MLQGREPIIYGNGLQKRCFSFIDDDIDILKLIATSSKANGEIINIGPDKEFVTIVDLANVIADILNVEINPVFMKGRPQEVFLANCSADKARNLFNYNPKVSLRDGLESMVDYISKRGVKPFRYHLDLEIINDKTPETWKDRVF